MKKAHNTRIHTRVKLNGDSISVRYEKYYEWILVSHRYIYVHCTDTSNMYSLMTLIVAGGSSEDLMRQKCKTNEKSCAQK